MPLPKPKPNERQSTFISRCMEFVLSEGDVDRNQAAGMCYSQWERSKKEEELDKILPIKEKKEMAYSHNSTVKEGEPSWGSVDKTKLPREAHANMKSADPEKKSTWKYPHHWISGGKMYLHRGGLGTAYAAAMGARSGQRASTEVVSHLNAHRKAIGTAEKGDLGTIDDFENVPVGTGHPESMVLQDLPDLQATDGGKTTRRHSFMSSDPDDLDETFPIK